MLTARKKPFIIECKNYVEAVLNDFNAVAEENNDSC